MNDPYNIRFNERTDVRGIIIEASGTYLGKRYAFRKLISDHDMLLANFDIIEFTKQVLKDQLIKFIEDETK